MISLSSGILSPPKVRGWKYLIGTCGGVVRSSLPELGPPPGGPHPSPSWTVWLQLGKEEPIERPRPNRQPQRGGRRAGRRRATAWPARKENLLPAEAALSPARLLGAVSQGPSDPGLHHGSRPRDTYLTSRLQWECALPGERGAQAIPTLPPWPHSEVPNATSGQDRDFRSPKLLST